MEHGPRGAGRGFGGLTRIFEGEHGLNGWNRWGWIFGERGPRRGSDFLKGTRIERVNGWGRIFGGPAWRQMGADWIIWDSYKLLLQNFNILVVLKLLL